MLISSNIDIFVTCIFDFADFVVGQHYWCPGSRDILSEVIPVVIMLYVTYIFYSRYSICEPSYDVTTLEPGCCMWVATVTVLCDVVAGRVHCCTSVLLCCIQR